MSTDASSSQSQLHMSSSNNNSQTSSSINESKPSKLTNKEEEICEDWEQLDQIQIKKSLQSIKVTQNNDLEEKMIKNITIAKPPASFPNQVNNNPIKILRRPPSDKNLKDLNTQSQNNTTQPIKTFEQREQEYAQARLRILGSAHPEQDPNLNNSSCSNLNAGYNSAPNSQQNNYSQNSNQNISNTNSNNPANILSRESVGPDGSKGFNNNRFYNQNNNSNNTNSNNSYLNKS